VFIADFSKVDHGILKVYENIPDCINSVERFSRVRMSIQILDIKNKVPEKPLTMDLFKSLLKQ